jgi:hypothetical protein
MSTPFCPEIVNNLLTIHFSRCKNGRNKNCRPSDETRCGRLSVVADSIDREFERELCVMQRDYRARRSRITLYLLVSLCVSVMQCAGT